MTIKPNPFSMLLGAASLGVVLLTLSAFQAPAGTSPTKRQWGDIPLTITGPIQIEGIPTPSQMMRIVEGLPFTVPAGKAFVLTALGSTETGVSVELRVDGATELHAVGAAIYGNGSSMKEMAPGFTVSAGSIIDLDDFQSSTLSARAWGYLADA